MRKYPIGQQNFKEIIKTENLYIDKTQRIYEMVSGSYKYVFLSRPRRFGKSLTVSVLKYLFEGNKELFKGLWIENNWEWEKKHPVIQLDFNSILDRHIPLEQTIIKHFYAIAKENNLTISTDSPKAAFQSLIRKLGKENKVVILVDEYDKPIINYLETNTEEAIKNREILKDLYSCIKPNDEYIRFFFMTGVSKFSRVSIFSDLNNLKDITMESRFADLCGITQEELEKVFTEEIEDFAKKEGVSREGILEKIRYWYNGFRFTKKEISVYNPFSALQLMDNKEFTPYWFITGTPTFLINLIKEKEIYLPELETIEIPEEVLGKYELENLEIEPLLYQTGYLTISGYDEASETYSLSYPNYEVRKAFINSLFGTQSHLKTNEATRTVRYIQKAVEAGDYEEFFKHFKRFFAGISYELNIEKEKYYQNVFYLVLRSLGFTIKIEHKTSDGRVDLIIERPEFIWIFEFKLLDNAENALKQIHEKKYYESFLNSGKQIVLFGVGFDKKTRNIDKWIKEELS